MDVNAAQCPLVIAPYMIAATIARDIVKATRTIIETFLTREKAMQPYVIPFQQLGIADIPEVGGKIGRASCRERV